MANDMDMLKDINWLKKNGYKEQAQDLEDLYMFKYGLGDSKFKTEAQFSKAKEQYIKKYKSIDNYV